jgi:small subunit ribosomal protein S6
LREYELVTVTSPILSQEESGNTRDRIISLITGDGGEVTHEEQWGMKTLAYPIRQGGQRFLEGNYRLVRFQTESENVQQIEALLRLSENIIRYLLVKPELPVPAPPPQVAVAEVKEVSEEPAAVAEVEEVSEEPAAVAEVEKTDVESSESSENGKK